MTTYVNALTIFKSSVTNSGFIESGDIDGSEGIPINLTSWTFGQLVAVTVWLPPLLQYMYLEISMFIPLFTFMLEDSHYTAQCST